MRTLSAFGKKQNRRLVLTGLSFLLTSCAISDWNLPLVPDSVEIPVLDPRYDAIVDGGHQIPALDFDEIDRSLIRTTVRYSAPHRPGTLVVDIAARRLYHVQADHRATRYAIGVGREEGLNFQGNAVIGRKEVWPSWTPTASMIERIPRYAAYAGGTPGGIENPLGARSLYLYRDGKDTQFRIHGTNEPASIGKAVSSGCIRLLNHDIIDLYARVSLGASVIVLQQSRPIGVAGLY